MPEQQRKAIKITWNWEVTQKTAKRHKTIKKRESLASIAFHQHHFYRGIMIAKSLLFSHLYTTTHDDSFAPLFTFLLHNISLFDMKLLAPFDSREALMSFYVYIT